MPMNTGENALDKFGFIQEEKSLHDAFNLKTLKILNIPDNVFQTSML